MAAWLIPALKAVLPHVGTIISAAAPVFTRRREPTPPADDVAARQIAELQAAATQNAAHVKDLAAQLKQTVTALEQAAEQADARLRRMQRLCGLALAVSGLALVGVLATLMTR